MIPSVGEPEASVEVARQTRSAARLVFRLLLALCLGSLTVSGVLAYRHWSYRQGVTDASRSQLVSLTGKAVASLDDLARRTSSIGEAVAADLTAGRLAKSSVVQRIKEETERHPDVHGVCVSYRPYAFDPKRRLYSVYYTRLAGRLSFVQADEVYDYTLPQHASSLPDRPA